MVYHFTATPGDWRPARPRDGTVLIKYAYRARGRLFAALHPLLTNKRKQGRRKKVATFSSSFYDYFLTIPLFFISWKKWNDIHAIGSETSNFPANFILQWHVRLLFSIDIGAEPKKEWKKKFIFFFFFKVPSGCDSKVCYTRKKECVFSGRSSGWREKGMSADELTLEQRAGGTAMTNEQRPSDDKVTTVNCPAI